MVNWSNPSNRTLVSAPENEWAKIKSSEVTNSVGQKIGKMKFVL